MPKRDVIEALTGLGLAIVVVTFTLVILGRSGSPRRVAPEATASASTDRRSPTPTAGRPAAETTDSEGSTGSVGGLVDSARAARRAANERTLAVQEETRRR